MFTQTMHQVRVTKLTTQPGFSLVSGSNWELTSRKPVKSAVNTLLRNRVPLTDQIRITFDNGGTVEGVLASFLDTDSEED